MDVVGVEAPDGRRVQVAESPLERNRPAQVAPGGAADLGGAEERAQGDRRTGLPRLAGSAGAQPPDARLFEDWDIYLCPVLGTPVPEVGLIDPVTLEPREVNRRQGEAFPYTPPFNFSGQPSLSLPLEMSASGLPIGMMFTARFADEATLFRLAAQLEKEAPWKTRKPMVWG